MKTARFVSVIFLVFLVFLWIQPVHAGQKTITIPKGAKVEKLGPGHFKFILPNRQIIELREFNPKTGMAGQVKLIDPEPPHKPVAGNQGRLTLNRLTREQATKLDKSNYVQIDDDVTWLPISITFQIVGLMDPDPPHKPRALSPQPDPPGKVK